MLQLNLLKQLPIIAATAAASHTQPLRAAVLRCYSALLLDETGDERATLEDVARKVMASAQETIQSAWSEPKPKQPDLRAPVLLLLAQLAKFPSLHPQVLDVMPLAAIKGDAIHSAHLLFTLCYIRTVSDALCLSSNVHLSHRSKPRFYCRTLPRVC